MCQVCGPDARTVAVEVERQVNTADVTDVTDVTVPVGELEVAVEPVLVEVSISAFSRSVEVKAPDTLQRVSEVALQLWQQTEDRGPIPVGASGFVMGEPAGPPPLEMTPRVLDPLYERGDRAA